MLATVMRNEPPNWDKLAQSYERLKEFVKQNNVPVITACQVTRPDARIYDKMDFAPDLIIIDYYKLIYVSD